ncbi:hypothetical protein Bca101_031319 [Brassica carinata]
MSPLLSYRVGNPPFIAFGRSATLVFIDACLVQPQWLQPRLSLCAWINAHI